MTRPKIYDKLMKGYLKNSNILKHFVGYELQHFENVCMNTSSNCAPNDMNTCTVCL